ncbi:MULTISPECIES: EAL domain-containing protein [unclassified Oceanispirochaeta]|uniref:EAL domain-containing protein n=1 Tax=unclassified Oceanispirochaeta TaxID=2635722 RepID=UPI000E090590|nr:MULTISPECIES: EAL domain-containing protein [unclassified Oceanispirochaeta]MBF9018714.1 EAL domain-containing protein [Oceanispirochaeta sp. M2]NPD75152.1 EAL domain-containing protein [Oceanispirochaeta sp. M1]RDG29004.1 EAL domain-containing protein [Oceanispirochaeta sp. M1]
MKYLKSLSISLKLFLIYSLLFLFLATVTFFSVSRTVGQRVQEIALTELDNATDTIIEIIRSYADFSIRNHLRTQVKSAVASLDILNKLASEESYNSLLSLEQAMDIASSRLLNIEIGNEGYFYVIDPQGEILIHPYEDLVGVSVREYDFVQKQIEEKSGYLEYEWKNPGDEEPREKVLYMEYFKPWEWILTASAYKDDLQSLIQIDDLRNSITSIQEGKKGYPFIFTPNGDIIIHPDSSGENFYTMENPDNLSLDFFSQMIEKKRGNLRYTWYDPGTGEPSGKIAFFKYIPEFDWIIVSSVYVEDYDSITTDIYIILLVAIALSTVIFLLISRKISIILTAPLFSLITFIENSRGTDYSERFTYKGNDEIGHLAGQFNTFLDDLENEKKIRRQVEKKNSILALFPEENPNPVIRVNKEGRVLYANPVAVNHFAVWGLDISSYLPDDLRDKINKIDSEFGAFEYSRGVGVYEVLTSYFPSQEAYYLFISDISVRKRAQAQLSLSESVFGNSLDGIVITTPDAIIERVNEAYEDLTGYREDELLGQTLRVLKSGIHDDDYYKEMWDVLRREGKWSGEIWNKRKNGETFPQWLAINSIMDKSGHLTHYVGLVKDVSEIKASEDKLKHQAYYDALTGLPNRVLFLDRLTQAIAYADRNRSYLAVMFLDLDNFKNINDSMGHNVGDVFLRNISDLLSSSCRDEDTIARLGGDEFLILMPGVETREAAVEVAKRLQHALRTPLQINGLEVHSTASMGISYYPEDGKDPLLLMQNADMAMYQSKKMGKGTYTHYEKEMNKKIQLKMELDGKMHNALEIDEFKVAYQPKVDTKTGIVTGAEALIRWESAESGMISPVDFIPLAEENGFILELGDWILGKVLEDLPEMRKAGGHDFEVAVNLSGRQFRDKELLNRITTIIDASGQPYESINFEITENMAMEDSVSAMAILDSLYELNVNISIDDFGTGYSSLSYLKRFKTQCLKIDKSFIDELPEDSKGSALVKDIIRMGQNLGMYIVAEGVESQKQLDFLREAGCDSIQGYYFSKPLFKDDFLYYLKNNKAGILKE